MRSSNGKYYNDVGRNEPSYQKRLDVYTVMSKAMSGDDVVVHDFVKAYPNDINITNVAAGNPDDRMGTLLLHVVRGGATKKTVEFLVKQPGIMIDAVNADRDTALMLAARQDRKDLVEILFANGADITRTNKAGDNVIQAAEAAGRWEMVKFIKQLRDSTKPQPEAKDTISSATTGSESAKISALEDRVSKLEKMLAEAMKQLQQLQQQGKPAAAPESPKPAFFLK